MKILLIHTKYKQSGGEDTMVRKELDLLREKHIVKVLYFQNLGGWAGAFQFLASIWNFKVAAKVRRQIKFFQPDVIHVHNWHFASGPIVFRVARKMKIPVVHTLHNYRLLCPSAILLHNNVLFTKSLYERFPWTAIRKRVYRNSKIQTFWLGFVVWFHKKLGTWKGINKFICLTQFAREVILESSFGVDGHKLIVKPNFTENTSETTWLDRENHFLFVGRLSEEKGVRSLLHAFKGSNFNLHIIGDGPLRKEVEKAQNETSNIYYLGVQKNEEVCKAMQRTQALIFPSICFEGMPMTILESFACGTPVIASNLGVMKSMIRDRYNGILFNSENIEDLRSKLEFFFGLTEDEKNKLQQNAFNSYKQEYSAAKQMEYFKEIYLFN